MALRMRMAPRSAVPSEFRFKTTRRQEAVGMRESVAVRRSLCLEWCASMAAVHRNVSDPVA